MFSICLQAIHIMGFFLFIVAHYIVPSYYCDFPTFSSLPHIPEKSSDMAVEKLRNDDYDTYMASDLKYVSACKAHTKNE